MNGQYGEGPEKSELSLYDVTTGRDQIRIEQLVSDGKSWKDITATSIAEWDDTG